MADSIEDGLSEQFKKPDLVADFMGMVAAKEGWQIAVFAEVEFKAVEDAVVPWPILAGVGCLLCGRCDVLRLSCSRRCAKESSGWILSEFEPKLTLAAQNGTLPECLWRAVSGADRTLWEHRRGKGKVVR